MIRLNMTAADRVIDLGGGVNVTCAPCTSVVFSGARGDPRVVAAAKLDLSAEEMTLETVKAVARRVIKDWDGVGDADGNPVPPTSERIDQLLDIWPLYDAFNARFCGPALMLVTEGNARAPLPNGTLAGALPIATDATNPAQIVPMN